MSDSFQDLADAFQGDFAELEKENERLLAENQRYEKALERIADVPTLKAIWAYRTDQQMGEIAREALAGDAE